MISPFCVWFQELPTHLLALGSKEKLQELLTEWEVFDILYNEDYSTLITQVLETGEILRGTSRHVWAFSFFNITS